MLLEKLVRANNKNYLSWPPDIDTSTKIDKKFRCPHKGCNKVFVNVHQADDCGCRFCLECLDSITREADPVCPSCNYKLMSNVFI